MAYGSVDEQYLDLLKDIMVQGVSDTVRPGVTAKTIPGVMFKIDMGKGFPLLNCKRVLVKKMLVELEGFIKGITDKRWYQERGCDIWDEWSSPTSDNDYDLGPIYGYQWRNFGGTGFDQLKRLIEGLKKSKETGIKNRKLIVSAWNPNDIKDVALEPCHVLFNVIVTGNILNLSWYQRSCDMPLGIPFNIASYATLLVLICKETGYTPGSLIGHFDDAHVYDNQEEVVKYLLDGKHKKIGTYTDDNGVTHDKIDTRSLHRISYPKVEISDTFKSILDEDLDLINMINFVGYTPRSYLKFPDPVV